MEEDFTLSWDMPTPPHQYALTVVHEKTVVLVRHIYADTGNVDKVYSNYLTDKISNNYI